MKGSAIVALVVEPDQDVFETWPRLTAVGLAFLGVFLVVLGLGAQPVRLLNGLALVFLASALAPDSTALLRSLLQARRWAAIEAALDWREARRDARLHDGASTGTNDPETDQTPQPSGPFQGRSKRNGFVEEDYIQLIQEADKPSS